MVEGPGPLQGLTPQGVEHVGHGGGVVPVRGGLVAVDALDPDLTGEVVGLRSGEEGELSKLSPLQVDNVVGHLGFLIKCLAYLIKSKILKKTDNTLYKSNSKVGPSKGLICGPRRSKVGPSKCLICGPRGKRW